MEFKVLGDLALADGGSDVSIAGPKQRLLLALLLAAPGHRSTADRLAEYMWEEPGPADRMHTLHTHVGNLRRALSAGGAEIATEGTSYRLVLDGHELDATRFETMVDDARSRLEHDPVGAASLVGDALSLWSGEAYGDLADIDPIRVEAVRLGELRVGAEELRAEALLAAGSHGTAVAGLEELTERHPYHEHLWELLMLALYRSGRQVEAVRCYDRLRDRLVDDLGVEPGPSIRSLAEKILQQDPALDARPTPQGRGNLPTPITRFIGRTEALAELEGLLSQHRLVTLLGPGGVGKTRLAIELSRRIADRYPDGVWMVELAPLADSDLLPATIARSLGLDGRLDRPPLDVVAEVVSRRRMLVVLDGCEHVSEAAAVACGRLLAAAPGLSVMVTSRHLLDVSGESGFRVQPLTVGDDPQSSEAVELFVERARSRDPSFHLDEAALADITDICVRLDAMPLAIELAAVTSSFLSPGQLLTRLDDRFSLLKTSDPGVDPRQQTLRAAVDWSYDLLSTDEQSTLQQLSVFRGAIGLEAAESVCVTGGPVIESMGSLVSKSLLTPVRISGETHYEMLETIREYAAERLGETDELGPAHHRHLEHFTALIEREAPRLLTGEQLDALAALEAEHGDLRACLERLVEADDVEGALQLASRLSWFWFLSSRLAEGWHWFRLLLGTETSVDEMTRLRGLIAAGQFAWEKGNLDQAREWLDEGLTLATSLGTRTYQGWALTYQALTAMFEDKAADAVGLSQRAQELFAATGNLAGGAFARYVWVAARHWLARQEGQLTADLTEAAREEMANLGELAEALGDRNFVGHVQWAQGVAAVDAGARDDAVDHLDHAITAFLELGNQSCLCHVLDLAAEIAAASDLAPLAAAVLGSIDAIEERVGNHPFSQRTRVECRRLIESRLSEAEFTRAWEQGRGRSPREIADQVRSELVR